MRKIALSLAVLGLLSAPVLAQTPMSFADVDTDANGELSFEELQVVWPDLSQAEFDAADADGSGGLSAEELGALQPAPAPAAPAAPDALPETPAM